MADQDFGLLQAVDERLAMYGWLTTTGVKFVIVVDMEGRPAAAGGGGGAGKNTPAVTGLRDSDVKPVCSTLLIFPNLLRHHLDLEVKNELDFGKEKF